MAEPCFVSWTALLVQFDNSEFYGFSEFWYSMDDVLGMGGQYMFSKYKQAAKQFCAAKWHHTWAR